MWLQNFLFFLIIALSVAQQPSRVTGDSLGCGILNRVTNTSTPTTFHVPWHVGIFTNATEHTGVTHEPATVIKCGGTIINETTIATNARCMWSDKYGHIGNPYDYFVGIGPKQDLLAIRRIHVLQGYEPSGDYSKSIALLELRDPVRFEENNVEPICVDFNETDHRSSNWTGFVVDVREEHPQQILTFTALNVLDVPQEQCTQILPGDISRDKFCVRPVQKNTAACNEDDERRSGSGLFDAKVFNGTQRFFLRGVVTFSSVSRGDASGRLCSGVIVATRASNYATFIRGY
ncbi:uncharacterized protein LOC129786142 [Lutzomyia longipalpis]|uniref:Putative trypsin n=1 Tax=Lutzomyia longipalpis TaxID=7200 RepID=A0A1B0CA72_LUTLO|nr:uncharacterized protein LOC129786142 [Lutzomyia longipalpis]